MTKTEYMRKWTKENRAKWLKINRKAVSKYRAKHWKRMLRNNKKSGHKIRFGGLRDIVLKRDDYKCVICLVDKDITVDHIDRNRKNNVLGNLQTLCRPCHGRKDGHPAYWGYWKWRKEATSCH